MKLPVACLLAACLSTTALGQGTILWNEAVNGPLSKDFHQPTSLMPMQYGVNSVIGTTEIVPPPPFWVYEPDYFSFWIPEGLEVQAIDLQVDEQHVWAWLGNPTFSSEIAFQQNPTNGELMAQWGLNSIPPGTYGMYMMNMDEQAMAFVANYRLSFTVVPEPSTMALLLAGAAGWVLLNRRPKSS